jgi:hypothetical protein
MTGGFCRGELEGARSVALVADPAEINARVDLLHSAR